MPVTPAGYEDNRYLSRHQDAQQAPPPDLALSSGGAPPRSAGSFVRGGTLSSVDASRAQPHSHTVAHSSPAPSAPVISQVCCSA